MVKSLVYEILALSPTLQVYLAKLWARGSLGVEFLERGRSFKGKRFKGKYRGMKRNLKLIIRIINEFSKIAYENKKIEDYIEALYVANMGLTPKVVAWQVCYYKRFRREMMPWLIYLARKVKKRLWQRMKRAGGSLN